MVAVSRSAALRFIRRRIRAGVRRCRTSVVPALQMTVGAVSAYTFAQLVLGHRTPLFAATSALVALGFSHDPRVRRVLEVALGCTLGIVMGEVVLIVFGTGTWQAVVVLFASIMLARFLDGGGIFTTQLGLQSLLVIFLPPPQEGPFGRSIDAVVGGLVALLVTLLTPRDPRNEPRKDMRILLGKLAEVLEQCATAVEKHDTKIARQALTRARDCQNLLESARALVRSSHEVTTISPAYRRYRADIGSLEHVLERVDYALRNARVLARQLTGTIGHLSLPEATVRALVTTLEDTSDAVDTLATGLTADESKERHVHVDQARKELSSIATSLDPQRFTGGGLELSTLIMMMRPLLVDLLEAAGLRPEEARSTLPHI